MDQEVVSGRGSFAELPRKISESGCRRLLIVRGKGSYRSSGASETIEKLRGCEVFHFDETSANPEIGTVSRCAAAIADAAPDTVLAVGGGSAIDTAKSALAAASGASIEHVLANEFEIGPASPRLWAAPTTAGSGSESTHFAVIYKGGEKFSIARRALKPALVFLDPLLTLSGPKSLTLASGLDAICQAIESHWSKAAAADSRSYSERALPLLLENFFRVLDDANDLEARYAMLIGANLAGRAIDLTKTTAAHAISYGLTSRYGLPHGIAVFTAMRPLVRLMDSEYRFFRMKTGLDAAFKRFGDRFPDAFETFAESAWRRVDSEVRNAAGGDRAPEALGRLASGVNVERLSNHPIALTKGNLLGVYEEIIKALTSSAIDDIDANTDEAGTLGHDRC